MIERGRSTAGLCARRGGEVLLALAPLLALACAGLVGGGPNYLTDFAALPEPGFVNVVVEIPAGTLEKWEVSEDGGEIIWEQKNGAGRVVRYLGYPANYGMVPRTSQSAATGGDGDPLDVLLLGAAIERGTVLLARPIGVLRLLDDGERDDKVLAVPTTGALADVRDLESLERELPGATRILETWFVNYKGPGRIESGGLIGSGGALQVIREASASFERADEVDPEHRSHSAAH